MKKQIITLIATYLIAGMVLIFLGCMPATKNEIKQTDVYSVLYVQKPYQETYRLIKNVVDNIKPANFMLREGVNAQLYTDNQTAEITRFSLPTIGTSAVLLYIEIGQGGNRTHQMWLSGRQVSLGRMYAEDVKAAMGGM